MRLSDEGQHPRRSNSRASLLIVGGAIALILALVAAKLISDAIDQARATEAAAKIAEANRPKNYFTDDDGVTFFAAPADTIAPFQHSGREAVAAQVFRCGEYGEPFVGYLEKLDLQKGARLVKRPHESIWVSDESRAAAGITTIKCRDGSYAIRVTP